jgi:hypothetical protein
MTTLATLTSRAPTALRVAAGCSLLLAGCGGSDNGPDDVTPAFAVMYEIFDDTGSSSYLSLLESLDDTIDPATSREFAGGRAFMRVYNGSIFVGDPTTPNVTRYSIADNGSLVEEGTISFANYGLSAGTIDAWNQTFLSPTKAYLFDYASATHIVWNPSTMEILGEIPPDPAFIRAGLSTETSPPGVRGNRLYRSIFWANYDTAEYSQEQILAVYDLDTDKLIGMVTETRCPNPGNLVHTDEAGTLYFSNWIWPVAGTLMHGRAQNCVLRILPGSETFDPSWSFDYAALSGGHEGGMFTYLADGEGLVSLFDESMTTFDQTTDPWELAGSPVWSIWRTDVEAGTGEPVTGIPLNAGAYTPLVVDGRTFVMVPKSDFSETRLYEITGNSATPSLSVPGWSYMLAKIQ